MTGHADERRQAAERRKRLEAAATAVLRLTTAVGSAQERLDAALAELRERHRRQLESVRAGGARLEELRDNALRTSTSWPPSAAGSRRSSSTWSRPPSGVSR